MHMNRSQVIRALLLVGIVMAGCSSSPQDREARFLKRGKEFLAKKDSGRALLEFKNAAQAMPKDAEPYYQTGLTYLAFRNVRYAMVAFEMAIELNPKHAAAQLKLAEIETNSRKPEQLGEAMARLQLS